MCADTEAHNYVPNNRAVLNPSQFNVLITHGPMGWMVS